MSIKITKEISEFWGNFLNENPELAHLKSREIDAWSFGNTPEMADELVGLVLAGKKTATCSLLRAYHGHEDEIPRVGVYSLICDGSNEPKCVVFYTDTFICRFDDVTEKHAYEEGEGDRSLKSWREAHHQFFSGYGNFKEDEYLVCERFEVVYK
jgi:uncharacterized protein YhfF